MNLNPLAASNKIIQRFFLESIVSKNANIHSVATTKCSESLIARDRQLIWHPFSQAQTDDPPIAVTRGKGAYLFLEPDGKPALDLVSSWWVNLHGHCHPKIVSALIAQSQRLEHVIFAGFTHEPAVQLCEKLSQILPQNLRRFFFSDNGSTAVEVALKMTHQFWRNQGQPQRRQFLCFDGAYHGDTVGAMSVGIGSGYHDAFLKLLFSVQTIPFPKWWNDQTNEQIERAEMDALNVLENTLEREEGKIAALIVEPLIQGASGMQMCRPEFIAQVVEHCHRRNILVIFDEVMTGFGRTGTLFAMDQCANNPKNSSKTSEKHWPDIVCLSKGLTGGFLPLALTVAAEPIYEAFLGDSFSKAFAHGHSYTANPLACAVAIASFKLLLTDETRESIKTIEKIQQKGIQMLMDNFGGDGIVLKGRNRGTVAAIDLAIELLGSDERRRHFKREMLGKGLLLRPLGQTVYLLPPYCTKKEELEFAYEKIAEYILENRRKII